VNTQALSAYPFGAPDASSEAASPAPFVILGGALDEREAVSNAIGPDVRVVVGRMGAGKTRCLVELKRRLEDEGNCDLTPIDFDLPSLSDVTQLAEALALEPTQRAEIWRKIWKRAIVRAALSQVLARAGSDRHEPLPDCLTSLPPGLVPSPGIPHSIYRDFAGILRDHQAIVDLRRFLDDREWEHVDYCFEQAFRQRTLPLCFFLDTGEDESSHAPRYWLWCQLGLVRQVLQFTHDGRLADKLRIFVAIRDQTWAELSNAKPAMYEQHPKVRQLRWGPRSAARFLGRKIQELPDEYRLKATTAEHP
jgi:hypothetical protein